ncbi:rhomboid family intramembrane serine protease [Flavicella sp.]|uniref:rhomboid family intramembrane serine protease n=1 Tax=Flavicella sp. TaxID=2957742 RepID=UPI002629D5F1|nr:rhomboid family intramembrane serine protease [Flavicella sp.]MDG1805050.1 rhomboid family intramembrane serine protease [Flavicella sp.]
MNNFVLSIIIINVLFSYKGIQDRLFLDRYKFQVGPILAGQKLRLFTSGFLHIDYMHLGFNMYALYIFSDAVVDSLGVLNFLIVYVGSMFLGNLFSLAYHKNEPYYSAVGASGAVSGIVYSAVMLYPNMSLIMFPIPIPIPGYIFGIGYLLYSIYAMKKQLGNVGHSAHLGGAIGGFGLTLLLYPQLIFENPVMIGLLAIPIVLLFVVEKRITN